MFAHFWLSGGEVVANSPHYTTALRGVLLPIKLRLDALSEKLAALDDDIDSHPE